MYYNLAFYDLNSTWRFTLTQETISDDPHFNNKEEQQNEIIFIHGNQAFLLADSSQPGFYTLIWRDAYYRYSLYGTFSSVEVLKKVAEGVTLN